MRVFVFNFLLIVSCFGSCCVRSEFCFFFLVTFILFRLRLIRLDTGSSSVRTDFHGCTAVTFSMHGFMLSRTNVLARGLTNVPTRSLLRIVDTHPLEHADTGPIERTGKGTCWTRWHGAYCTYILTRSLQ